MIHKGKTNHWQFTIVGIRNQQSHNAFNSYITKILLETDVSSIILMELVKFSFTFITNYALLS